MGNAEIRLMLDAGAIEPTCQQEEAYFVWLLLMGDPVIDAACRAIDWHDPRLKEPYAGIHIAYAAMNQRERLALGERVRACNEKMLQKSFVS